MTTDVAPAPKHLGVFNPSIVFEPPLTLGSLGLPVEHFWPMNKPISEWPTEISLSRATTLASELLETYENFIKLRPLRQKRGYFACWVYDDREGTPEKERWPLRATGRSFRDIIETLAKEKATLLRYHYLIAINDHLRTLPRDEGLAFANNALVGTSLPLDIQELLRAFINDEPTAQSAT